MLHDRLREVLKAALLLWCRVLIEINCLCCLSGTKPSVLLLLLVHVVNVCSGGGWEKFAICGSRFMVIFQTFLPSVFHFNAVAPLSQTRVGCCLTSNCFSPLFIYTNTFWICQYFTWCISVGQHCRCYKTAGADVAQAVHRIIRWGWLYRTIWSWSVPSAASLLFRSPWLFCEIIDSEEMSPLKMENTGPAVTWKVLEVFLDCV